MKQNGYLKALVLLTVGVIACAVSWSQWIPYNQKQQMLQTIDEWRFYPATAKVIASDTIALPGSGVLLTVTGAGAADDDLSIITGGIAGDMIWIRPGSTSQTITLKHASAGSPAGGNITTPGAVDYAIPDYGYVQLQHNGESWISVCPAVAGVGGLGDFVGPSSATDNAVVRFNSTTGKLGQNSSMTVSDAGGFTALAASTVESSLTLGTNGQDGSMAVYSEQGGTDYLWTLQPHATMTASFTESMAAALPGGTAFDKVDATGTHSWDTNVYLTVEADTLATVTSRGETATGNIILPNAGVFKIVNGSYIGTLGETTLTADRTYYMPDESGLVLIRSTATPEQGDILYWDGTGWTDLAHGTAGQVLQSGGHAANPSWVTSSGGGGVLQGNVTWSTTLNLYPNNEGSIAGNARGESSVDLQVTRSDATQICGGYQGCAILGGTNNRIGSAGSNNENNVIAGGLSNSMATSNTHYMFIGGGSTNVTQAQYAAIAGGSSNTAAGQYAFIGGGTSNSAGGTYSAVPGGYYNSAAGVNSWCPGGREAASGHYAAGAWSSGAFSQAGDTQSTVFSFFGSTSNGTQTEIALDNSTSYFTITSGVAYSFHAYVFGVDLGTGAAGAAGDRYYYELSGTIANIAGTTALLPDPVVQVVVYETDATFDATIVADNTNDRLALKVTGAASKDVRWRCRLNAEKIDFTP